MTHIPLAHLITLVFVAGWLSSSSSSSPWTLFVSAEASFQLYPNYSPDEARKDFDSLNKWLIKVVVGVEDPEVNMSFAMAKLRAINTCPWLKFYDRSLLKPLQLFADLAKVEECDDRTLELMRYIDLASRGGQGGHKRVDKVAAHYGHLVAVKCEPYLDGRFLDILGNIMDRHKVGQLFDVIKPNWMDKLYQTNERSMFHRHLSMRNTYHEFDYVDMLRAMKQLAKDDPKNKFVEKRPNEVTGNLDRFVYKNNVRYVYETYLLGPCQHYHETMKQFVESFYAIKDYSDLNSNYNTKFVANHPEFVQLGLFRYFVCERILDKRLVLPRLYHVIDYYE